MQQVALGQPCAGQAKKIDTRTIYPKIRLAMNHNRQFLCCDLIPQKYKTLRATDPRIQYYFAAINKLLGSTYSISLRDLWVCQKNITIFPILVFFTEPLVYPIMDCCLKCVYVQFEAEESGAVKCSQCKKLAFSFVHLKKTQTPKQKNRKQKQNSVDQTGPQVQKKNQKIFKEYKALNEGRKSSVRKIITSNQHRHKSIKQVLGLSDGFQRISSLVTEIVQKPKQGQNKVKKYEKSNKQNTFHRYSKPKLAKQCQKSAQNIEFIIQIKQNSINNWIDCQQIPSPSTQQTKQNPTNLSEVCKQIKSIIQQIFT